MDNNILLVYYSFEGNTEYVARKLAETIDIKRTIRLHPLSEPPHEGIKKFAIGGKSALRHEKVGLQQIELNYDEYDTIFIACPVWRPLTRLPSGNFWTRILLRTRRYILSAAVPAAMPTA